MQNTITLFGETEVIGYKPKRKKLNTAPQCPSWFVGEIVEVYRPTIIPAPEMARVTCSKDVVEYARLIWEPGTLELFECFYTFFLNRGHRFVGWTQISKGGIAGTVADPKLIFRRALSCGACGIILAHNHPSGNLTASQADIDLTKKIKEAGKLMEIQVLDHVILTPDKYFSFADEGIL